jgi:SAM-dependent methyltransferase
MLVSTEECLDDLRCPITKAKLTREDDRLVAAETSDEQRREYPLINGKPILVNFEDSVLNKEAVQSSAAESQIERKDYRGASRFIKKLLSPEKEETRRNIERLRGLLTDRAKPARLLIIGGGSVGQGMDPFYDDPDIKVYSFDIYASPFVQFIADAHEIPMPDDFFDGVIIQAVLEHVLQPAKVVDEIWRVLKPAGHIYAETPFMQHVHEGAYDFTRFTESGHRYLFRQFDLIDSGVSGGPGLQFMWSADYFARSLFRSRAAGKVAKLAFFWTQYLDRVIPQDYAVDAASGVYFLGSKSEKTLPPTGIIQHYKGAQ